jgi:fructose-bisphosphate aldolase class II
MHVIEEIHASCPNTHLVMHGSSSVPQDLQDIINENGGEMPQTWGVPVEEIVRGIKHGVRKVNIDTDNRMAMTGQFRKIATEKPLRVRSAQVPEGRRWTRCGTCAASASRHSARPVNAEDQGDLHGRHGQLAMRAGALDPQFTTAKAA